MLAPAWLALLFFLMEAQYGLKKKKKKVSGIVSANIFQLQHLCL